MEIAVAILGISNIALVWGFIRFTREASEERQRLTNALMARTPQEFRELETIVKPESKPAPLVEDLMPLSEMSDQDFLEKVNG